MVYIVCVDCMCLLTVLKIRKCFLPDKPENSYDIEVSGHYCLQYKKEKKND